RGNLRDPVGDRGVVPRAVPVRRHQLDHRRGRRARNGESDRGPPDHPQLRGTDGAACDASQRAEARVKLVLLGAPASGKGTQAAVLCEKYGVPKISTGDMLREALAKGTELGKEASRYMNDGKLVPDSVVIGLVEERVAQPDA